MQQELGRQPVGMQPSLLNFKYFLETRGEPFDKDWPELLNDGDKDATVQIKQIKYRILAMYERVMVILWISLEKESDLPSEMQLDFAKTVVDLATNNVQPLGLEDFPNMCKAIQEIVLKVITTVLNISTKDVTQEISNEELVDSLLKKGTNLNFEQLFLRN